ncbi:MAG: type IV secretion system DNA-binding domain-containing protein [Candidatus Micrarchaeaceae archaeon]
MYKILKAYDILNNCSIQSGILIGNTGINTPFYIPMPALQSHFAVFGKTNAGKSTLLLNIAEQLIMNNKALVLIDPHGELAYRVLKVIPDHRSRDLIYITPEFLKSGNEYYAITMNALHVNQSSDPVQNELERLRAVDNLKLLFSKDEQFSMGTWGPRLEVIFSTLTKALLDTYNNATITDLLDLLVDKDCRARFLRITKDREVAGYLKDLYRSKYNMEYVTSSINKLLPIKKNMFIRELIASKKQSIDFMELLSGTPIIIVNLSKSNISETLSSMVGSLIINMLWHAKLKLNLQSQLFLIIDELQNFSALNLKSMLSEGRKYGISMILATQHLNQIQEDLLESMLGNIASICAFNIGASDSQKLKHLFSPYPGSEDKIEYLLQNMDRNHILFRTMQDGKHTILTLKTIDHQDNDKDVRNLIESSVKRYGTKIELNSNSYDFVLFAISRLQNRKHRTLAFEDIYREVKAIKNIEISELDLVLRTYQSRNLIADHGGFFITVDGEKYLGSISEVERVLNEGEYHRYLINRAVQYFSSMNMQCTVLEPSNKETPDAILKMGRKIINVEAEYGELTKKVTILNHLIKFRTRAVIFLTFKDDAPALYEFLKAPYKKIKEEGKIVPYTLNGEPLDWTRAGNIVKRSRILIIPDPGEVKAVREYRFNDDGQVS